MGICTSCTYGPYYETEEGRRHAAIERQLRAARRNVSSSPKVLLLGSGDSGKSTILKQMRIINGVPFTEREMEIYRLQIFYNLISGMRTLLDALRELSPAENEEEYPQNVMSPPSKSPPPKSPSPVPSASGSRSPSVSLDLWKPGSLNPRQLLLRQELEYAPDLRESQSFPLEYQAILKELWNDPSIKEGLERANSWALPDNLHYLFESIDRFFDPEYFPSVQDIIRCRVRTTGITETVFSLKNAGLSTRLHVVDVGGQRSERRKWIHCFQDVTAVWFMVGMSGYNQGLVEDATANQMQDAMTIWDGVCSSQWFRSTALILFLNKTDLFEEKVAKYPIKRHFPDFDGPEGDVNAGKEYFKRRFLRLAAKGNRAARKAALRSVQSSLSSKRLAAPSSMSVGATSTVGSSTRVSTAGSGGRPTIGSESDAGTPVKGKSKSSSTAAEIKDRSVYCHFTNATDTRQLKVIMVAVCDIILRDNFLNANMI